MLTTISSRAALIDKSVAIMRNHTASMLSDIIPLNERYENFSTKTSLTAADLRRIGKGCLDAGLEKRKAYDALGQKIEETRHTLESSFTDETSNETRWAASYNVHQTGVSACQESCVWFMVHLREHYPNAQAVTMLIQNNQDAGDAHAFLLIVDGNTDVNLEELTHAYVRKYADKKDREHPMDGTMLKFLSDGLPKDASMIVVDPWLRFVGSIQKYLPNQLASLYRIGYVGARGARPTVTAEGSRAILAPSGLRTNSMFEEKPLSREEKKKLKKKEKKKEKKLAARETPQLEHQAAAASELEPARGPI